MKIKLLRELIKDLDDNDDIALVINNELNMFKICYEEQNDTYQIVVNDTSIHDQTKIER